MLEASLHAAELPSVVHVLEKTGIRADDNVAPASSWNSRSGIRNATKNAASSAFSIPNALVITTCLITPRKRERINPNATMNVARAILFLIS